MLFWLQIIGLGRWDFSKKGGYVTYTLYEEEFVARNAIVLSKFKEQSADVNQINPKHIVIFYGAAHMPYFEAQLCEKYTLEFQSEEWVEAVTY